MRRSLAAQIAPHRVARQLQHSCDLANALALPSQDPDLHRFLHHQHEPLPIGVAHAGVGHFSTGDPGSVFHRQRHLHDVLEMNDDQIAKLYAEGVLVRDPLLGQS